MKEKNIFTAAPSVKRRLRILLKIAYFVSGFILALAISDCRARCVYLKGNTVKATDLLERWQGEFSKDNKGAYIFNGVDL